MTELSSVIQIANSQDSEPRGAATGQSPTSESPPPLDKTLSSVANLAQLLPTGTVLAFQALSPSFSNHGVCYTSNKYITLVLVLICTISCVFFSFTDSFKGTNGKLYYGVATFRSFVVFNYKSCDGKVFGESMKELRIRRLDYVHAAFAAVVFLTITFSDTEIQHCFFQNSGPNMKQILQNLPLGAGFLSSIVFLVFPTTRKGIGYSDVAPHPQ